MFQDQTIKRNFNGPRDIMVIGGNPLNTFITVLEWVNISGKLTINDEYMYIHVHALLKFEIGHRWL